MSDNVITVNDQDFDDLVAGSDVPVLVDFWAAWCGPCKAVAPVLEEIASDRDGELRIAKLNIDDNPRTAQRYQVMSIPTLLVFKDGEARGRIVGSRPKNQILSEVEAFLA